MLFSVLSKNIVISNDFFKKHKNTIVTGRIWLKYKSLTVVILEATFLDKYTTCFLLPWGFQIMQPLLCKFYQLFVTPLPIWRLNAKNTRQFEYKAESIRVACYLIQFYATNCTWSSAMKRRVCLMLNDQVENSI